MDVGARVEVNGVQGIIRFVGNTQFAPGIWIGVELDAPAGKNDGSVNAVRYFDALAPNHGVFVRSGQVNLVGATTTTGGIALSRQGSSASSGSASSRVAESVASTIVRDPLHKASSSGTELGRSSPCGASLKIKQPTSKVPSIKPPPLGTAPPSTPNTPVRTAVGSDKSLLSSDRRSSAVPSSPLRTGPVLPSPSRLRPPVASSSSVSNINTSRSSSRIGTTKTTPVQSATSSRPGSPAASSPNASAIPSPQPLPPLSHEADFQPSLPTYDTRTKESSDVADLLDEAPPEEFDNSFSAMDDDVDVNPSETSASNVSPSFSSIIQREVNSSQSRPEARNPLALPPSEGSSDGKTVYLLRSSNLQEEAASPTTRIRTANVASNAALVSGAQSGSQQTISTQTSVLEVPTPQNMVPLRELEDLKVKLRMLESNRNEERDLHKEHEIVKAELESAQLLRTQLSERVEQLQDEVKHSRRHLKEAVEKQHATEKQVADLSETLEMMTLDKEVAEERAEVLQAEVEALKEKVEELSLDLEVMREEANLEQEEASEVAGSQARNHFNVEMVQLERQNERLKEALVKLRDMTGIQEAEAKEKIQELEHNVLQLSEFKEKYLIRSQELDGAQSAIEDLKMQLDAASDLSSVVEQLTEKNLQLNEHVEELTAAVADLEALKDVNDELEENHLETEKQLQAEIDLKDSVLGEVRKRIDAQEQSIADYERTISQFRILVASQQKDIERLQASSVGANKQDLSSQTQAMVALNLQLQLTAIKALSESIEMDLRRLETAQALEHLDIIKAYLPDAFAKTEAQPANTVLLFRRIAFKANLVSLYVGEHTTDNRVHPVAAELRQKGCNLANLASRFGVYMQSCSIDAYSQVGKAYYDLLAVEKRLNMVVELLKEREFERSDVVVDLQRCVSYLMHLAEKELRDETEIDVCTHQLALASCRIFEVDAERVDADLNKLGKIFIPSDLADDADWREALIQVGSEFIRSWGDVRRRSSSIRAVSRKLVKHLQVLREAGKGVSAEVATQLKTLAHSSGQVVERLAQVIKAVELYIVESMERREIVNFNALTQKSNSAVEPLSSSSANVSLISVAVADQMEAVLEGLTKLESLNLSGETINVPSPPWLLRGEDIRNDMASSTQFDQQITILKQEIVSFALQVKSKEQSLAESVVKVEVLEKRIESLQKQNEAIKDLDEELTKAKERCKSSEEALETILAEMKSLEEEKESLKKRFNARSPTNVGSRGLQSGLRSPSARQLLQNEGFISENSEHEEASQIETLQAALRYLRSENTRLKARASLQAAASLFAPHDPVMRRQIISTQRDTNEQLKTVVLESKILARDAALLGCEPRLVNVAIARPLDGRKKWMPLAAEPVLQYHERIQKLQHISKRGMDLRERVRKVAESYGLATVKKGEPNHSPHPHANPAFLGRITLPSDDTVVPQQHKLILTSHEEWQRLHAIFVS